MGDQARRVREAAAAVRLIATVVALILTLTSSANIVCNYSQEFGFCGLAKHAPSFGSQSLSPRMNSDGL